MASPPLTSRYPGLANVQDPHVRQVLKNLFDMVGGVQQQASAIGTVSQPLAAPLDANTQQLKGLANPTAPQDAVTLAYMQHYVESRVQTVAAATATTAANALAKVVSSIPVITTGPNGPPTTGVLTHGFDLSQASVVNSPADIATWPATGAIDTVTILPAPTGVFCDCSTISPPYSSPPPAAGLWPQPASGPAMGLQYTVWIVLNISGSWITSGFIQMWVGRPGTGDIPVGTEFSSNWAYDGRWGAMSGYQPAIGEQVGFFLSAGNARGQGGVTSVRERSEVVPLNMPDANGGKYA